VGGDPPESGDDQLGDLDGVEGRPLAEIVAHDPEREATRSAESRSEPAR